jgi:DNA end-binding protein Ku
MPAMKAIWNGHISFGLISIPISVHSAVESSERVSFRLLHRKDHAPIHYKKFCSKEDIEVSNDEIVRGYELGDDEFATVEKDELDKVEDESSPDKGEMEVLQFVDFASLNPLSFDHPYYAAPRKGGEKAYGVLRDALLETRRVGIVRFQLRSRPTLGALIPGPRAIAIESLRPFEEVRPPSKLEIPAPAKKSAEVKMARLLIDQMSAEGWDPTDHPNTYRKSLEKLLASRRRFSLKEKGKAAREENVLDLMEALRKSVGQAKSKPRKATPRRAAGAA